MIRVLPFLLALFLLSLGLPGCKEDDIVPPTIEVQLPTVGTTYQVPDTVAVQVVVTDETALQSVTVKLTDPAGTLVDMASVNLTGETEYAGTYYLKVDDKNLVGGEHQITVTATDGINEQNAFVAINVNPIIKELRAIYAMVQQGSMAAIYRIDSLFQSATIYTGFPFDLRLLAISSQSDMLLYSGGRSGRSGGVDLRVTGRTWLDLVPFASDTLAYLDIAMNDNAGFISGYEGELRGYSATGNLIQNTMLVPDRPESLFMGTEHVYAERSTLAGQHFIDRYRIDNGFRQSELQVPMDVVDIAQKDDDEFYLIGHDADGPRLLIYQPEEPGYFDPHALPTGQVFCATTGDAGFLYMAHTNGVYRYLYNPTVFELQFPGIVPRQMIFEPVHGLLIMAVVNEVQVYGPSGQLLATVILPGTVYDIATHHTR